MANEYILGMNKCTILMLTSGNKLVATIIDIEDMEKAKRYTWHAAKQRDSYRVVCNRWIDGKKRAVYLHRLVMDAKKGDIIDHIDCDPLNSCKNNLRPVDYVANGQNRKLLHPTNTSGIRNVTWHKRDKRWQASITVNTNHIHLGYYMEKEHAEQAVLKARAFYMPYSQEARRE